MSLTFDKSQKAIYWSNKNKLRPNEVGLNSNKKFWFNCDKCLHEFFTQLDSINKGSWCPYCTNQKLCDNNGCNICYEKSFASHEKSIYFSKKNIENPRDLFKGTHKKYIFECETCKHDFETAINKITGTDRWCPFCSNPPKKLCNNKSCDKCLKKSFASHPNSKYWSTKNKIKPRDIFLNNHDYYLFDCDKCNHEIELSPTDINSKNIFCYICSGRRLCNNNECKKCFEKSFASHEKAKNWSKKNKENPRDVFISSKNKYIFQCDICNHDFEKVLYSIVGGGWCPYCSNQKLCNIECNYCYEKTFASHEKSKYWSNKNKEKASEVFKSSGKKYLFDCDECKNEFEIGLDSIQQGCWCNICKFKTEKKLFTELIKHYGNLKRNFNVNWCKNKKTNRYLPFDFVIDKENIIIELDGKQHFEQISNWLSPIETHKRDLYKLKCANKNSYSVIRILQEDVFYDRYDWLTELKSNIEKININKKVQNIFMCKNDEYKIFDKIDYSNLDDSNLDDSNENIFEL